MERLEKVGWREVLEELVGELEERGGVEEELRLRIQKITRQNSLRSWSKK